jgi:putative membrane protein
VASALVSALHVLALAIGLPAVVLRGRALAGALDEAGFQRLFAADTAWGAAALLWIVTGLLRAFAGLELEIGARAASTRSTTSRWAW